jgi:hypothetical protein
MESMDECSCLIGENIVTVSRHSGNGEKGECLMQESGYDQSGTKIIIFHVFEKRTQKTPLHEIDLAENACGRCYEAQS